MTVPANYFEEPDDCVSRLAAAAITDHVFAYVTGSQTIALTGAGGRADGVTVGAVTATTDQVSIWTDGAPLVKAGGTVTAGHDVMSDAAGKAVDATNGNFVLGYAETGTTTSGDLVRIRLYERPHHTYGSAVGQGSTIATGTITGDAIHAAVCNWQNPETGTILISRIIAVTVAATGAATANIGTTAVSAITGSDNMIDGADIGVGVGGVYDSSVAGGTNGKGAQTLAASKWVTFAEATGNTAGASVTYYIFYTLL